MAQHKAPTAVTIASIDEKSGFAEFVERYWKAALIVVVLLTAAILFWENSKRSQETALDQSWEKLLGAAKADPRTGSLSGKPRSWPLSPTRSRARRPGPGRCTLRPPALQASASSTTLGASWRDSDRRTRRIRWWSSSSHSRKVPRRPAWFDQLEKRLAAQAACTRPMRSCTRTRIRPQMHPRSRSTRIEVRLWCSCIRTSPPSTVRTSSSNAREGFFTGIKFHRAVAGSLIQSGDQNTISGDVVTWGLGGAPNRLEREENNLRHFAGFLSAFKKPGEKVSNGSQFVITVGDTHYLDGQQVVFGKVIDGMDTAHKIEQGTLAAGSSDRPEDPAVIQSMEVL